MSTKYVRRAASRPLRHRTGFLIPRRVHTHTPANRRAPPRAQGRLYKSPLGLSECRGEWQSVQKQLLSCKRLKIAAAIWPVKVVAFSGGGRAREAQPTEAWDGPGAAMKESHKSAICWEVGGSGGSSGTRGYGAKLTVNTNNQSARPIERLAPAKRGSGVEEGG